MKQVKQLFFNNKNLIILYIFLIILLLQHFKIPYNIYSILKRPIDERMIRAYGYCNKEGYGYVKYILENHNKDKKKSPRIVNINQTPEIYHLLNLKNINDNSIIIVNFIETKTKKILNSKIKKQSFSNDLINLKNYQLIHRYGNCYYFKK